MVVDEELTLLMIPGPVAIHPRVYRAMSRVLYGHRTPEFQSVYKDITTMLKQLLQTDKDVLVFAGSGTAAMEAAIANLIEPGDKVLNVINGKFSERWYDLTKAFRGVPIKQEYEYGRAADPKAIAAALEADKDIRVVTICHNETSTAVLNPAEQIGRVVREHDRLLVVDGITSVGGDYVFPDKWNFDMLVTGSQKCLGTPPGLGMIWVGPRAWQKIQARKNPNPTFYLDLPMAKKEFDEVGNCPFTPAVTLMYGLRESLRMIFEEGYEPRVQRHRRLGRITRAGYLGMGLELLADPAYYSNTVTAVKYPATMKDKDFTDWVRRLGILVAGGQGPLKGKIFRTNHMNVCTDRDILMTMAVVEVALKKLGAKIKLGSGVAAAEEQLLKDLKEP